jgi:GAF domain-containing protein
LAPFWQGNLGWHFLPGGVRSHHQQSNQQSNQQSVANPGMGNPEFIPDRRHCVRQAVRAPAFASFDGVTGGMILDLSDEGMAMQAAARVETRGRVQVQLDLSEPAGPLETTGYIAWADALGRAGVRFSDLPEEARHRLDEWLAVNAETPGQTAPRVAIGRTGLSGWGGKVMGAAVGQPAAISLEAESEISARGGVEAGSGTVQYEFSRLGTDLNVALRLIAGRARSLTRGASAAIALAHKGSVLCRASVGDSAPALGTRLDVSSGFCGECFRTGKSLRCDDAEIDARVDALSCGRMGVRSILAAPIRYDRETVGVLAVFGEHPFTFDEGDVAVAESLAHTVLVSMKQADVRG